MLTKGENSFAVQIKFVSSAFKSIMEILMDRTYFIRQRYSYFMKPIADQQNRVWRM
jgi:hypothetical protein